MLVLGLLLVVHRHGFMQVREDMVRIPAAVYTMGTDSAELATIMEEVGISRMEMLLPELPKRTLALNSYYMDLTDVTNAAFFEFVTERPVWSPSQADPASHNGRYLEHWEDGRPHPDDLDRPVVFVTWYAAVAYCEWKGRRLPTEAEWEYAAGGGNPENRYPWGSAPPSNDRVSWAFDGIDEPVAVASYPPNAFGLYDMSGNVWKYLADEWADSNRGEKLRQDGLDPDTPRTS